MPALSGVVYPHLFHSRDFVHQMLKIASHSPLSPPEVIKVDNYEVGTSDGAIFQHRKNKNLCAIHGDIYNLSELIFKLQQAGYPSKSYSSSEVLLLLYEIEGEDFIHQVNGDFSLVIIDTEEKSLFVYRDRMGKCPLYWSWYQGYFIFSTQIKSLLSTGLIPQEISKSGFSAYLCLGMFPQDHSPIKHINKLPPGHYLKFQASYGVNVKSYWSLSSLLENGYSSPIQEGDVFEIFEEKLNRSIQLRSQNIESPISLVGGGLGSAAISSLLSQQHRDLSLASISIKDLCDNDSIASQEVSKSLCIDHQSLTICPNDFFTNFTKMIWALDEPIGDSHLILSWNFCRLISQKHSSFFSGMGAQELLAMHQRYQEAETSFKQHSLLTSTLFNYKDSILKYLSKVSPILSFRLLQYLNRREWKDSTLFKNALFSSQERKRLSRSTFPHFNPYVFVMNFANIKNLQSTADTVSYFDSKTQLCDRFLLQYHNFSTYFNLKWQAPFLDHQLIEFLAKLPSEFKSNQPHLPSPLKNLLKKRNFSDEFIQRPRVHKKDLFDNYADHPLVGKVSQFLKSGVLVESGLIHPHYLKKYVLNLPITRLSFNRLFSILALETWYRLFIVNNINAGPQQDNIIDFLQE
ncbi:MAG: hypothetical protein GWP59_01175 [Chlamydiales bacterium]|nr:hypothetical protein [Chlamydiales bacterium]